MSFPQNTLIDPRNHNPALDGVRGLAIIMVLLYHYCGFLSVFSLGWSGVDLFFVLSGFLITKKLIENRGPNRYYRFYRNRALRIMPLYYLVLLSFFVIVFLFVNKNNLPLFNYDINNAYSYIFFLQNWTTIFHGLPNQKYLLHLWSLAIEEQFYIVWPFIVYIFYQHKHFLYALLGAIIFTILLRVGLSIVSPLSIFCNTFCRIDAFIIGALAYFLFQKEHKPLVLIRYLLYGSLIILIGYLLITGKSKHGGIFYRTIGYTLLALIYGSLIYYLMQADPKSLLYRLFNIRFLRFTGKISYGLYIFHWPVLLIVRPKLHNYLQARVISNTSVCFWVSLACCALLSWLISVLSYYYYESFFLRRKK